jgi:DNA topoisomerase VI subunit B
MDVMSAVRIERVAFRTSRLLDFVGRRELTAQIGHDPAVWPIVILKELAENGLDAAEEAEIAPAITVEVSTQPGTAAILVRDNGPGLSPETVADILDYSVRVSSREAYVAPTRGAQGNALKTVIAMAYALTGECGETLIESRGVSHRIVFRADAVRQEPRIEHHTEPAPVVRNGTTITVQWPATACVLLADAKSRFLQIAAGYAVLNPHLSLEVQWNGEVWVKLPASDTTWCKWRACDPTSAHWYDMPRLARYAAAHVARDQDHQRPGHTVRDFISEFRGLSGSGKQKLVLEESGLARLPLAELFDDGVVDEHRFAALLGAMQKHTRPVKPRDLGIIGSDHLQQFCNIADTDDATFHYRAITGETSDEIPFVVEAAFAAAPQSKQSRRLILGVNFAAALANPFRSVTGYDGLEAQLAEQCCGPYKPVIVILHLACARVDHQDRGKSAIVPERAITEAIEAAIETVTRDWAKQCKAKEREEHRMQRASVQEQKRRPRNLNAAKMPSLAAAFFITKSKPPRRPRGTRSAILRCCHRRTTPIGSTRPRATSTGCGLPTNSRASSSPTGVCICAACSISLSSPATSRSRTARCSPIRMTIGSGCRPAPPRQPVGSAMSVLTGSAMSATRRRKYSCQRVRRLPVMAASILVL